MPAVQINLQCCGLEIPSVEWGFFKFLSQEVEYKKNSFHRSVPVDLQSIASLQRNLKNTKVLSAFEEFNFFKN